MHSTGNITTRSRIASLSGSIPLSLQTALRLFSPSVIDLTGTLSGCYQFKCPVEFLFGIIIQCTKEIQIIIFVIVNVPDKIYFHDVKLAN
jgi:hypothetical protein